MKKEKEKEIPQNESPEKATEVNQVSDVNGSGSEAMAITSENSALLKMLTEAFGISGSNPEEIVRAVRKSRARAHIEERARANEAEKRYKARLAEAKEFALEEKDFDLEKELSDPVFAKLIRCGFDIRQAYRFTHFENEMEKSKLEGFEEAVALLRKGQLRPEENGMREQSGITDKRNVEALTGGGIRAILKRVEKGAKVKF